MNLLSPSSQEYQNVVHTVDDFLKTYWQRRAKEVQAYSPELLEAVEYSLFSGGKRFRPVLCLAASQGLGIDPQRALPLAAAIEMVHTYSLIHDDLPCMDNDDYRRGQLTSHKKFNEATALLAGDALLTEAFLILATDYAATPATGLALTALLSQAAGPAQMIGAQMADMGLGRELKGLNDVEQVHLGKTAALISVALEGAGLVAGASSDVCSALRQMGLALGLCFQIKDDLLDRDQDQSPKSYLYFLGEEGTAKVLREQTQKALVHLRGLPPACEVLSHFFHYNETRTL